MLCASWGWQRWPVGQDNCGGDGTVWLYRYSRWWLNIGRTLLYSVVVIFIVQMGKENMTNLPGNLFPLLETMVAHVLTYLSCIPKYILVCGVFWNFHSSYVTYGQDGVYLVHYELEKLETICGGSKAIVDISVFCIYIAFLAEFWVYSPVSRNLRFL